MSAQNFTAWFVDYPSTHVKAGETVEVVPRALYEQALRGEAPLPTREQYRGPLQPVELEIPEPPEAENG